MRKKEKLIFNYHLISCNNRGLDFVIYKKFIQPKKIFDDITLYKQLEYFSIRELEKINKYANKIDKEGLLSVLNLESIDDYNLYYEVMNGLMLPVDHKIQWKAINMLVSGKKLIDVYRMKNDMKDKDIECLI